MDQSYTVTSTWVWVSIQTRVAKIHSISGPLSVTTISTSLYNHIYLHVFGLCIKSTDKAPDQDFLPRPFINTLELLWHWKFQTPISSLVALIELSINSINSKNTMWCSRGSCGLTIFYLGDVSQYFCPGSCQPWCHISVADMRGVFLSLSPPPTLIQLFWFLSLWFILCSTCEAPPFSFISSESIQYESGRHQRSDQRCKSTSFLPKKKKKTLNLPYLLKASSRSSQSQQHVHWQASHSQQHRGSSGSGGFNFSHCITTCSKFFRPSVQLKICTIQANTFRLVHCIKRNSPAGTHKYIQYPKSKYFFHFVCHLF